MVECPFCFRGFRQPPEKIGARCPQCRMPLYEDPARRKKTPEKDYGKCEQHPDVPSVAKCARCEKPICYSCRTRWQDEPVCPRCIDLAILDDEPSPVESQLQSKQAWFSVFFAAFAWLMLLLTLIPYSTFSQSPGKTVIFIAYVLFLGSFVPALFGLGFAMASMRLRGGNPMLATTALVVNGSQLSLAIALIVINISHN